MDSLTEKERYFKLNSLIAEFYSQELLQPDCQNVVEYLNSRGLDLDTIKKFKLGFVKSNPNKLEIFVRQNGFELIDLEALGILNKKDSIYYNMFQDRILFPIYDFFDRLVGFGSKALSGELKYINSSENFVFEKNKNLYLCNLAKSEIKAKKYALLMEGYFDSIVSHLYGFRNAVSSLGTSLTDNQIMLLKSVTNKVIIVYDPDSSGIIAAEKAAEKLTDSGFEVKVITLPSKLDPDEMLIKYGREHFLEILKTSEKYKKQERLQKHEKVANQHVLAAKKVDFMKVLDEYHLILDRSNKIICPFHNEKTASCGIDVNENIYHCFGCDAKGDIITFVMEIENLSFSQAVRKLLKIGGVVFSTNKLDEMREKLQILNKKKDENVRDIESLFITTKQKISALIKNFSDDEIYHLYVTDMLDKIDYSIKLAKQGNQVNLLRVKKEIFSLYTDVLEQNKNSILKNETNLVL